MKSFMKQLMVDIKVAGNELFVNYDLHTEKCSWSIFDIGGVELCKGKLNGNAPHKIPLDCLSPNVYQLCVIDGDKLLNARFRVS